MDRTFGKIPTAPIPTLWVITLCYLFTASMIVLGGPLPVPRAFCEGPPLTEVANLAIYTSLILACAVYVAIFRRRIGLVIPPVVFVMVIAGVFVFSNNHYWEPIPPGQIRFCTW